MCLTGRDLKSARQGGWPPRLVRTLSPVMIRFFQISERYRFNLARQTVREQLTDILVISVSPRGISDNDRRITCADGTCAVALTDMVTMAQTNAGWERGYAMMCLDELAIYNCYCSPNCTIKSFVEFLNGLEAIIRHHSV